MKKLLTAISTFILANLFFAQSYEDQISNAEQYIKSKEYCKAFEIFKLVLSEGNEVGKYDYFYGAVSAANCGNDVSALKWLRESQKEGLGSAEGEIDYLKKDPNFINLQKTEQWSSLLDTMEKSFTEKKRMDEQKSKEWVLKISDNAIKPKKSKYNIAKSGFALYFSKVDSIKVPYLVYIPKNYDVLHPTKTIIYLHGGVKNTEKFNFDEPELMKEPIFTVGEKLNTIIIYPFGKKDFGWVSQKKAFENIYYILKQVQNTYNVDKKKIYLGGMSNGGTATFWFASQRPSLFAGFYAIAANPKLEIGEIDFNFDKPLYEIHAKDDQVFNFKEIEEIYKNNKSKNWHFESVETGDHGFIYQEEGTKILENLISELIK